ncbi:unnamed protein product [Rhizoctonia solani]|nr:unnamed protein product [Rhizoctonia solani]
MAKLKSTGKKPEGDIAPGANWLALKKKLPSSSKGPLISKQSVKAQSRVPSASFSRGRVSTSPAPDVIVGSSKLVSKEVKALQDMVLGKGIAGEKLVGEPGRYVAIDCEMVGVGEYGTESSLARASIVDFQGRVILDEFVLQRERVTDYRTHVSGIRPKDMINAKPFSQVQALISALLSSQDRVLVGHALHNDLSALLLSHPAARIRDTQVYSGRKPIPGKGKTKANESELGEKTLWDKYRSTRIGLKKLVKEELGVDIQTGEHSSVTDARAAMAIYRLHKRAWDASLPVSHVRRAKTRPSSEVEGDVAMDEGADQTQGGKRKRRSSAGEFPGGGRRGVSSGLGVIVTPRAPKTGKEKSADQGGPKWWQTLGGGKSKGKMTLPIIVESPLAHSEEDLGSPPPSTFDPTRLGFQLATKKGESPGTSDDSLPLLTPRSPPTPNHRTSAATQLPTVPITHTSLPDIPWTVTLGGFMSRFEPVPMWPLIVHTVLCCAAFPAVYWLCTAASGVGLFWARAIVGAVTGIVGFTIGYNLIRLSRRGINATVWATVIHESMHPDGGVTLEQLNDFAANPASPWSAIRLLFRRTFRHKGARRTHRKNYDRTPWTLTIIVFILVAILSACLVFVFGRIVDIYTKQERQLDRYIETYVAGDLSAEDVRRAAELSDTAYSNFNFTWSLIPFSSVGLLPMGRTFQVPRTEHIPQATHNVTDTIHIAETYTDQLVPNGAGFGTFDEEGTGLVGRLSEDRDPGRDAIGGIVRWPKWGIRVGCQVLEGLDRYLTPISAVNNMTYLYVPKTALYSLFQSMDIPYPAIRPVNLSALLEPGDPMPQGIAQAEIAVTSKWWQNGVAHSFKSVPLTNGSLGTGWLQLEIVLTRLHESYAPNSTFGAYANPDVLWRGGRVGYDVAICVEEIRSWVVDAYNSSAGNPTTLRIMHKGMDLDSAVYTRQNTTILEEGTQSGISSTGKFAAFGAAHDNSRNVMLKDNGRDFAYVPNPTVVSFTNGTGPLGYTRLDPDRVANAIAKSDSQHLLPYLAGTQPVLARSYPDKTVAYIRISKLWLGVSLLVMLLLGYIVAIFVPRLPLGLPRRDFGVYSWLAAIEGDAILAIPAGVGRYEHLEELQKRGAETKVRYAAPNQKDWQLPVEERVHKEFFERYYSER